METPSEAKLLRIFIGESDKIHHTALYEAIVQEARAMKLAGATVWRGILSFGPTSHIRSAKILDLSSDLPIIIEIVDKESKIDQFLPALNQLFEKAQCGGLMTIESVKVIHYVHGDTA
jgi:PII-like signaling protein